MYTMSREIAEDGRTLKQTIAHVLQSADDVLKASLYIMIRRKWRYMYNKHQHESCSSNETHNVRALPRSVAIPCVERLIRHTMTKLRSILETFPPIQPYDVIVNLMIDMS